MSKKTIYALFDDKEPLFIETVNYCFEMSKLSEIQILEDESLGTLEKIKRILIVLPESYIHIDWRKVYAGKDKFPAVYGEIKARIETDWHKTIELIEQRIEEGVIKPISIPVLKAIVQATFEQFWIVLN
ncbi:TetR/AcrR family transcriptional regulator [Cellulosilyticum ruminicola]|uniref:TetR/AcrR family transcriptional regulator n=1 Tax=Cellulosilyticum ruminicola TaxID=425254 RepID=UPI0006D25C7C|nr:TetR/AcrR family transcriptional regulator [Cellulosilyticum ruminicola]